MMIAKLTNDLGAAILTVAEEKDVSVAIEVKITDECPRTSVGGQLEAVVDVKSFRSTQQDTRLERSITLVFVSSRTELFPYSD